MSSELRVIGYEFRVKSYWLIVEVKQKTNLKNLGNQKGLKLLPEA